MAARYNQTIGQDPLEYVTRWRLELDAHRLAHTDEAIAAIARSVGHVGYVSETAFGLAFKRELSKQLAAIADKPEATEHPL
ncbi:hypothetical protein ACGFYM_37540 [Streptomyces sp. NPDC048231]|uniref:hypothetical protein n=1 Tax=Streptomyces sp. NPDC048231 TaxID=3365519 RepID=UPI00371751B3